MGARASCQDCDSEVLLRSFEDCGASPSVVPANAANGGGGSEGDFHAEMPDGSNYEGQFKGWERHGTGRLTWAIGDKYEGQFSHNAMHGSGTMRWVNGVSYRGQWNQSEVGPHGTMSWPDGREYRGSFLRGEKHGQGRLVWPGGRCYEGQWQNGRQEGFGFISVQKGPPHLCEWSAGKLKRWLGEPELATMDSEEQARTILAAGAVRLLRASWLLQQPEGYVLQRQQDLPPEALLSPSEAQEALEKRYGVVAVSSVWLSKAHPDPEGFHLKSFRRYLRKHVAYFSGLPEIGVFWDFASMRVPAMPEGQGEEEKPEKEKKGEGGDAEQQLWQLGLRALGSLYGGRRSLVAKLATLPEGCKMTPYEQRGWCFVAATLCGLLKDADLLLDLGLSPRALAAEATDWDQLRDGSIGSRPPPVLPEDMKAALSRKAFGQGEDLEPIFEVYQTFFAEAAPHVALLNLSNPRADTGGWGDTEMKLLCRALPQFTACKALSLANHTNLSRAGLKPLQQKLRQLKSLQRLVMPQHLEQSSEGKSLAKEWSAAGKRPQQLLWVQPAK